jgi:hypothetical protein
VRQGRQLGTSEDDVLAYQRMRQAVDSDAAMPLNKNSLAVLTAQLRALEGKVATCLRLLGVKLEPLNLTDAELVALHQMAEHYSTEGWPPHVEETWADTFERLQYEDLARLAALALVESPWVAFYKLCDTMRLATYDRDLRGRLEQGRDNLYSLAVLSGQLAGKGFKAVEMAIKSEAAPRKVVVRRIERGREVGAMPVPAEYSQPAGEKL